MGECFFWYRPTRVVPDQRPLNGRCCKWGEGANPLPIPHPLENFLFKKENDNVCELKGGFPVNGIASVNPMQRMGTSNLLYCVVLTMEMNGMNKRGYKIKGPH